MSPSYLLWPVSPSSVEERRIGVIIFVEDLLHNVIFYSIINQTVLPTALSLRRYLSLHEHYSMDLLREYGVSVPQGEVASTPEQAKEIAERFGKLKSLLLYVLPSVWKLHVCI